MWAMLIIMAQAVMVFSAPETAVSLERFIFGLANPLPVFMPLYFVVVYGVLTRHLILSAFMGLLSWWTAPVILMAVHKSPDTTGSPVAIIADGFLFALIGLLSALVAGYVARRRVVRT
ncbi:MAG: hypothetical protein Q8P44_00235 [Dehalococcoidia bacterium]|nr:hypothetical protein [Dehalococcoidia bacterium]